MRLEDQARLPELVHNARIMIPWDEEGPFQQAQLLQLIPKCVEEVEHLLQLPVLQLQSISGQDQRVNLLAPPPDLRHPEFVVGLRVAKMEIPEHKDLFRHAHHLSYPTRRKTYRRVP